MTLPERVDVLVVGYGPVGAALAGLLGRYGVRTLVVDKLPDVVEAPRAIALDNEALRILQMVGLREDAFAKVVIPQVRMHSPHFGEFARINTRGAIDCHPKLVTFYQPELERALRANAETHPTVTARRAVEMARLEPGHDGVRVVLRTREGDESVVHARYVVGADGASSNVRAAIGEEFEGQTYAEDWLIVDAQGVPKNIDHVEFLCNPDRPTPHMVAPGGRTRWEFMLKPGETREAMESDAAIAELLKPWGDLDTIRIERKAVYRFHARVCRRFRKGSVFLAGDAAHVTPPFAGQGLVAGLRDAANLAWKLAWVVREHASVTILDSYDEERRPHAAKMIALAKRMGRMIMPRSHTRAVLFHGAMALLRQLPPVREFIDELGAKPQNAFPRGLFVPRSGSLRGAWLPQWAIRSDGGQRLSDDVLGPALALVGFGVDPATQLSEKSLRGWSQAGGSVVALDEPMVAASLPAGWCAVVRPDRTVLHDGSVQDADRLVRESLRLLGTPGA